MQQPSAVEPNINKFCFWWLVSQSRERTGRLPSLCCNESSKTKSALIICISLIQQLTGLKRHYRHFRHSKKIWNTLSQSQRGAFSRPVIGILPEIQISYRPCSHSNPQTTWIISRLDRECTIPFISKCKHRPIVLTLSQRVKKKTQSAPQRSVSRNQ